MQLADNNKTTMTSTTSSGSFDAPLLPSATQLSDVNNDDDAAETQAEGNFDGPRPRVGTFVSRTSSVKRKKKRWSISFLKVING